MPDQIIVFGRYKNKKGNTVTKYTGFSIPNYGEPYFPVLEETMQATLDEGIAACEESLKEAAENTDLKWLGIIRVEKKQNSGVSVNEDASLRGKIEDERQRLKEEGKMPESTFKPEQRVVDKFKEVKEDLENNKFPAQEGFNAKKPREL